MPNKHTQKRIITTTYAHRSERSLLVFEIRAEVALGFQSPELPVLINRCGNAVDWTTLTDFDTIASTNTLGVGDGASSSMQHSLRVKVMEENCDVGHYTPGQCNNTKMQKLNKTEVGIAYQVLPSQLNLKRVDNYTAYFVASFRTSLEPGLEAPGAAAAQAAKDLKLSGGGGGGGDGGGGYSGAAALRAGNAAGWEEEWEGGIEVDGNLTIAASVNSSLYYILAATRSDWPHGLSPGGLARDDYEGTTLKRVL